MDAPAFVARANTRIMYAKILPILSLSRIKLHSLTQTNYFLQILIYNLNYVNEKKLCYLFLLTFIYLFAECIL